MTVLGTIHMKHTEFRWNARKAFFLELENHECMKVVTEKIVKLFHTYLMNPANRETFVVYGISSIRVWQIVYSYEFTNTYSTYIRELSFLSNKLRA